MSTLRAFLAGAILIAACFYLDIFDSNIGMVLLGIFPFIFAISTVLNSKALKEAAGLFLVLASYSALAGPSVVVLLFSGLPPDDCLFAAILAFFVLGMPLFNGFNWLLGTEK